MSGMYRDLSDFLLKNRTKGKDNITHTRIGCEDPKIHGGCYEIREDQKAIFNKLYYNDVLIKGKKEYLTEKQIDNGPIAIDLDFRYNQEITERQHTEDDIINILDCYLSALNNMIHLREKFNIYVFEKPHVNETTDVTKDGIHIIIGLSLEKSLKIILRNRVLKELEGVSDELSDKLINNWESVVDEGVCIGNTNWQLYGSRKPNHEAYGLTYLYTCTYNKDIDEFSLKEESVKKFDFSNKLNDLSIQKKYELCEMKDGIKNEFQELENKNKKGKSKAKNLKVEKINEPGFINYADIDNEDKLNMALERLHDIGNSNPYGYKLKELHDYAMILPKKYWGAGSYDKWIRVGWALRNTDYKLYVTWLKFSTKSDEFKWDNVRDLWERWNNFNSDNDDGLTEKSLFFWARQDAYDEYEKKKREHISYYIDETLKTKSDYDKANVLYQWYKDRFICVSIKQNTWYEYREQRWFEIDSGITLRNMISTDIFDLYLSEIRQLNSKLSQMESDTIEHEKGMERNKSLMEVAQSFKKTDKKNNIMREARDLFYVKDFISLLDSKNHLLCFNNGVIDFHEKTFRKGVPEDYTSKCTNLDYIPLNKKRDKVIMDEITEFMYQLFPNDELRNYMWEHLSSVLMGKNDNQTFNIYTGRGRNGKSKLVELMSMILGDYKATVPITLITQRRGSIGGTSSEVVQLIGVRYAVMQEPSVGDCINEGIMKEITGGDPLQGRALFKDTVTFIPQFKLVVCTNHLFDIKSNDDGTWRRIRVCDFVSLFTENPVDNDTEKPFQFKVDKYIDKKFEQWKHVFMAMLVEKALETQGNVNDCDIVCAKSQFYRETQDHFAEYVRDNIKESKGSCIGTQKSLKDNFNDWWKLNYGGAAPNGKGLFDYMNNRYGKFTKETGWKDISLDEDDYESDASGT
tara:strand:- start:5445 stop:8189 length:2745 start_codon:yes stop_codon:yes gene_type:complete